MRLEVVWKCDDDFFLLLTKEASILYSYLLVLLVHLADYYYTNCKIFLPASIDSF